MSNSIIRYLTLSVATTSLLLFQSCTDDEDQQPQITRNIIVIDSFDILPQVRTEDVTDIGFNTATVSGSVADDKGEFITRKGFCWTQEERVPDLNDEMIELGNGAQPFQYSFDSLPAGTSFYLRAFAENATGIGYGNTIVFETVNDTLTDIDGNKYGLVKIGESIWMTSNLEVNRYSNGDTILKTASASTWLTSTNGLTATNNKLPGYAELFGQYYNWYAVADDRNICPSGFHIPNENEITELIFEAGGSFNAGSVLKDVDTTIWSGFVAYSNNELGFSARPAGIKTTLSLPDAPFGFQDEGLDAYFWYFDNNNFNNLGVMNIWSQSSSVNLSSSFEYNGFSVRCVKD